MADVMQKNTPIRCEAGVQEELICWFDSMDDATLLFVIDFLNFRDRIRLERVSKRWKRLLQQSWKSVAKLNLKNLDNSEDLPPGPHTLSKVEVTVNGLIPPFTMSRCGRGLKKLLVSNSDFGSLGYELRLDSCPSLTSVTFKNIDIRPKHLQALVSLGPKFCELAFISCDILYSNDSSHDNTEKDQVFRAEVQEAFSALFSRAQLERFECSAVDYYEGIFWVGECLTRLPHTLRYLDFPWCEGLSNAALLEFLGSQRALVDLRLTVIGDPDFDQNAGGMTAIMERITQLKTFCLKEEFTSDTFGYDHPDLLRLHGIGKIFGLRELDVSGCSGFGNDDLKAVCVGCPDLKILRMRNTEVENFGLMAISSLDHLEILDIFGLDHLHRDIGNLVSGLKEIYLDGIYCTRDDLQCIARKCPRLESLHIERCYKVKPEHLENFIGLLMAGERAGLPCKILVYDDAVSGVSKSRTFISERSADLPMRDFEILCGILDDDDDLGSENGSCHNNGDN